MKIVLVAEGLQASRKVMVNALTRNGYKALEAADGAEALSLFDGRGIDLLITEFKMPNLNGVELVDAIRKMTGYEYTPVLVLSTEANDAQKKLTTDPNTVWVKKPFDLERFMKLVEKSMSKKELI
ncbi:MAG TPA: response regulator [Chryseolinea sp.]